MISDFMAVSFLGYPLMGSPPSAAVIGRGRKNDRDRSRQRPVDGQSAVAPTASTRRSRRLVARPPSPGPVPDGMGRAGRGEGVEIRRADEQDHGDVLIHSWYPRSVFWTFVKHFRQ